MTARIRDKAARILLLALFLLLPGCMTTVSQMGYWSDSSVGHMVNPEKVIYGGTRTDVEALSNGLPDDGLGLLFFTLTVIDTPLSFIADTLLLPLTCGEEWWMQAHAEDEADPEEEAS